MSTPRVAMLGLGCAAPTLRRSQEDALALALSIAPPGNDDERRRVEAIYRKCGVDSRGVASGDDASDPLALFHPATPAAPHGPTTAERLHAYAHRATPLARRSAAAALADAQVAAARITHLVTATCTGFGAPGWDIDLITALGLPASVHRTHVGFMGCHAALNALRVAQAIAAADPAARVLLCCTEVCSIHFKYQARPDQIVANALFADGSASCVIAASQEGLCALNASASHLFPASADQMSWSIGDHGFEMTLAHELPNTVRDQAGAWLARWLSEHGLTTEDVHHWAVHPGGPRILTAVAEAAALPRDALAASRAVLAEHGNMSSPTVLFILERMRQSGTLQEPAVLLSFGPGITAEAMLLR
ncbi:MAG: type III polyketide synthase [Phycisphaerales bacterium]|nr:type III polyketide synthase [Phycisphaerales bacterium]